MSKIYSVETTARILNAIRQVSEEPAGRLWLDVDHDVAAALTLAGFRCFPERNADGRPGRLVYTPQGYRTATAGIPTFLRRAA